MPTVPRRPWLAALLSLLASPIGQFYAGRLRRAVLIWLFYSAAMVAFSIAFVTLPAGRIVLGLLMLSATMCYVAVAIDAYLIAKRYRAAPLKPYQRWWAYVMGFVVLCVENSLVAFGIRATILEAFAVPGRAMTPTIRPDDRILVDKLWYGPADIRRNDVVVFRSDGPGSPMYVMRVAGLPGEQIEVVDERVMINGEAWDDPYGRVDPGLLMPPELMNYGPEQIPPDSFFVLGDNRRMANDSRWLGMIPLSDLYGKAFMVYWSHQTLPDPLNPMGYMLGSIDWSRAGAEID